jgi:TetR/AcrR family transcriptional regulator, regulator of cefoperazone and chloramphenicol sensitivity
METIKKDIKTRERLLESACKIFASKGFRDATIADISKMAGTNIAAVNYHFGDKNKLYVECWREAFGKSLKAFPPDGGIGPEAPAEERFKGRILATMQRFAFSQNYEFEIMSKEMANPTGLLMEVVKESIEPLRAEFHKIIRELLGENVSQEQVRLCAMSTMAQCINIMMQERHRKTMEEKNIKADRPCPNFSVETLADHVTRFSLAGLYGIRKQAEESKPTMAMAKLTKSQKF